MADQQFPKISVIVRTMGRPQLSRAIDSARRQTWPHIELVLVVADPAFDAQPWSQDPQIVAVAPGIPLDRPKAANAGLDRATGEWLQFLDEDDWIDPEHVDTLWRALQAAPDVLLAYSDMTVHKEGGTLVHGRGYWKQAHTDQPFFSMHPPLFSSKLRDLGCRFDEQFVLLEDWDFFLQCGEHTDFLHVPVASAHYDPHSGSSGGGIGVNRDEARLKPFVDQLTAKWGRRYGDIVAQAREALRQADAALQAKNFDAAEQAALAGLSVDPGNPMLLNRLAACRKHAADWAGVVKALRRACDSDRKAFRMNAELAAMEHKFGYRERAVAQLHHLASIAGSDEEKTTVAELGKVIG